MDKASAHYKEVRARKFRASRRAQGVSDNYVIRETQTPPRRRLRRARCPGASRELHGLLRQSDFDGRKCRPYGFKSQHWSDLPNDCHGNLQRWYPKDFVLRGGVVLCRWIYGFGRPNFRPCGRTSDRLSQYYRIVWRLLVV